MKTSALQSINPVTNLSGVPSTANWIKITKHYTDFSAASLTNNVTLLNLVPKGVIHACVINNLAIFVGGFIASSTLSVGTVALPTKYCAASTVSGGIGLLGILNNMAVESMSTATPIVANLITTGGFINTLTSGNAEFYLLISVLP